MGGREEEVGGREEVEVGWRWREGVKVRLVELQR